MENLKDLVRKYEGFLDDAHIIEHWFTDNGLEDVGLSMIPGLAKSKSDKIQKQLDYARTWIPAMVDMRNLPEFKHNQATAEILNSIQKYCMLSLDLPQSLVDWAKENIPKMKTPMLFFMPTVDYLKERYGVEFEKRTNNKNSQSLIRTEE